MNEFSLICRILGSFFYRTPEDPVLEPLWQSLNQGQLGENWPLAQEELINQLQRGYSMPSLTADYQALFVGEQPKVSPFSHHWPQGTQPEEISAFLTSRGMPQAQLPANHFGLLLLAASWLEDHRAEDENQAQLTLFYEYLLPWCGPFLGKVEAYAETGFYRALATVTRGAVQAMAEELFENEDQDQE